MDEDIRNFIKTHGFAGRGDYYCYHISLGFYYSYSRDAYRIAEKIQDGEIIDDYEACIVLNSLKISQKTYQYFRNRLFPNLALFDTSETVIFHGCRLECGRLEGNTEIGIATAKKWMKQFYQNNRDEEKIKDILGKGDQTISGTLFTYEVAAYILYLCNESVDYRFLELDHELERGQENGD